MNKEQFIVFGDIVSVKVYYPNGQLAGYFSGNTNKNAIVNNNPMFFCMTPFGFFAEDEELKGRSLNSVPIVFQQLTWKPGCILSGERGVPIAESGNVVIQQMDISTRDDFRSQVRFYEIADNPKIVNNPHYDTPYYVTLSDEQLFLTSENHPYLHASSSLLKNGVPLKKGAPLNAYIFKLQLEGSLEKSRNFPFSQTYAPFGSLQGMCTKCTKCTR